MINLLISTIQKILTITLLSLSCLVYAQSTITDQLPAKTAENSVNDFAVSLDYSDFQLVGSATLTFLFWDIYRSTLYTTSGRYPSVDNKDSLVFKIEYLRDVEKSELIEQTIAQWQHIGLAQQQFNGYISQLENIWPNIKKGDTLALLINDSANNFYLNNRAIGGIDDSTFGQLFIDIWLSKKTSQPKLRLQLIGGTQK